MKEKERIDYLTDVIKRYQDEYYKRGESSVSDAEYDRLWDELIELEKKWPDYAHEGSPTKTVGSDLTEDFPEVSHTIRVLSLDKAYKEEEILSYFTKTKAKVNEDISFVAEEKIDGISIVLYYEQGLLARAVTRGNGYVGNDVTVNVRQSKEVPVKLSESVDIAVRGELYITKEDFIKFNDGAEEGAKAQNPRNLAAGLVRRKKNNRGNPLRIWCYEGFWTDKNKEPGEHIEIIARLKSLGFKINPHTAVFSRTKEEAEEKLASLKEGEAYSFSDLGEYLERRKNERSSLPYEIDGLVFKVNEKSVRESLGYTEHHPRWAIAFKFDSPSAEATLLSVTVQVGRTGRITPVAEISATKIGGSTIKRATLHNQEYIDSLELAIGDSVVVSKHGDVIPAVEKVVEKNSEGNKTFRISPYCPSCGKEIKEIGALQYCTNYDCPDRAIARIVFFTSSSAMDIDTLGESKIRQLYDEGLIKDYYDIYSLTEEKLLKVFPTGEKKADKDYTKTRQKLLQSIEESKSRPFQTVLSSLGVAEIGKKKAQILINGGFDTIEKIIGAKEEDLSSLSDIGPLGAKEIVEAFKDPTLLKAIALLKEAGLSFAAARREQEEGDKILEGTLWCVTGTLDFGSREDVFAEIERRGGRTGTSVSSKTTHLLQGRGGGSKSEKARMYGTRIVSEEEFLSLIGKV